MGTYIEPKQDGLDKVLFLFGIGASVLLFVALTQPVWRGDEMLAEMKANCDKVNGIMIERSTMFGSKTHKCSPNYASVTVGSKE